MRSQLCGVISTLTTVTSHDPSSKATVTSRDPTSKATVSSHDPSSKAFSNRSSRRPDTTACSKSKLKTPRCRPH